MSKSRLPTGAFAAILAVLVVLGIVAQRREAARQREEIAAAQGLAQVVEAFLVDRTELVVQRLDGRIDVRSVHDGSLFHSEQNSTVPFSVQYSVDLAGIDRRDMKYDAATKTLMVEIPPVAISTVNVDESRRVVRDTKGLWVSRTAGEKLSTRGSMLAGRQARQSAERPDRLAAAAAAARTKVERLIEAPLRATGRDDINVVVRFATDGNRDGDHWDVTPSIDEVLARARAEGGR